MRSGMGMGGISMGISASRAKLSVVACVCLLLAACGGDDSSGTSNEAGKAPVNQSAPPVSSDGSAASGAPGNVDNDPVDPTPTDPADGAPIGSSDDPPSAPGAGGAPGGGAPDSNDEPLPPIEPSPNEAPAEPTDESPSDWNDEPPADATDEAAGMPPTVPNSPPMISGTPPTVVLENTPYLFVPDASDADGDILHFSIANRPHWATFEPTTGRLEGTPSSADVATYQDIRISVTDGADDAHLAPFSITVTAVARGAVEVSWLAPSENEDGSPLTDLPGYKIYWGTEPDDYPYSVTIDNPAVVTYVVENLVPGTYYFVATAFNAEGTESDPSDVTSVTIP